MTLELATVAVSEVEFGVRTEVREGRLRISSEALTAAVRAAAPAIAAVIARAHQLAPTMAWSSVGGLHDRYYATPGGDRDNCLWRQRRLLCDRCRRRLR